MTTSHFATAGSADDLRISITTENELRYWTKALNCTEDKLREAISVVGTMLLDVRKYLNSNP